LELLNLIRVKQPRICGSLPQQNFILIDRETSSRRLKMKIFFTTAFRSSTRAMRFINAEGLLGF
jgi:hypothetical protein